jgi:hypothetical protein
MPHPLCERIFSLGGHMRRFYISNIGRDAFTNTHLGYCVRDRSYQTSANVMCNAVSRSSANIIAAALNAMEEKIPSHNKRKLKQVSKNGKRTASAVR